MSPSEEAGARAFVERLDAAFARASRGRASRKTLRLGSRRVAIAFGSDDALAAASPALSLADDNGETMADVSLALWDSASTGVAPPECPWPARALGPLGEVRGFGGPRYRAAFNVHSQTLSLFDTLERRGHAWMRSARSLPGYEQAAPLRTLLAWGVQAWGWQLVHAGCVALGTSGVLLVGKGGSGKSTCALSCLGTELDYVADDYCALSLADGRAEAHALYASGKLEPAHLAACLPALSRRARAPAGEDKAILYLEGSERRVLGEPVRLRAVVLPQVSPCGASALVPCNAAVALAALAPSSLFQIPALGAATLRFLSDVVRSLPCYTLSLGSDLSLARRELVAMLTEEEPATC